MKISIAEPCIRTIQEILKFWRYKYIPEDIDIYTEDRTAFMDGKTA